MRLFIEGGGPREEELRRQSIKRGHTLPDHGPWDAVVLTMPRSTVSEDVANLLPRGQQVLCGYTDAAFDCLAKKRGWRLLRVLNDEGFTEENAYLSAEGAVFAAMREGTAALRDARCMVIGYGRIGQSLTGLLRAWKVRVIVAARRPESRAEAGEGSIPLSAISRALPQTDIVFNTVPANILTASQLSFLPKDALYMELASPPYGIAPEEAEKTHVHYVLESGIPGRYCPSSAAGLLLDYLERTVKTP